MTRYSKALVAAVPFLLASLKVLSDGLGDGRVSAQEWITALIAGLATLLVYAVPNRRPAGQPSDPGVSEQDPKPRHRGVRRGKVRVLPPQDPPDGSLADRDYPSGPDYPGRSGL